MARRSTSRGLLVAIALVCSVALALTDALCNDFQPRCGLDAEAARKAHLLSHDDLRTSLEQLVRDTAAPDSALPPGQRLLAGPLIRNAGDNSASAGLIDIDVPLPADLPSTVSRAGCGTDPAQPPATIRAAVVCTVVRHGAAHSPEGRGNRDASAIGRSTHGRPILAARAGDPAGLRVAVLTQLHGNEPASTEAAIAMLQSLVRGRCDAQGSDSKCSGAMLAGLDVLFVLRANPDGGEPHDVTTPPVRGPVNGTAGFFRESLDATAGGGFKARTEEGFLGVVGRGYNLNRYIHTSLQAPVRPVEAQAVVAALLAFRPAVVLDMHGDAPKAACALDPRPVRIHPNGLPSVRCADADPAVPTLARSRSRVVLGAAFAASAPDERVDPVRRDAMLRSRALAARLLGEANARVPGKFTRFSQLSVGAGRRGAAGSDGSGPSAAMALGAVLGGWEVLNFGTTLRPAVNAMRVDEDGKPAFETGIDVGDVEPCFLKDNICIHRLFLETALRELPGLMRLGRSDVEKAAASLCEFPLADGVVVDMPPQLFGKMATDGAEMVPINGQLPVPLIRDGICPGDAGLDGSNGSATQVSGKSDSSASDEL